MVVCDVDLVFFGKQGTITLVSGWELFTFGLDGGMLDQSLLPQPKNHQLVTQWAHKEFLQFATSFEMDGKLAINIQELQLTSNPLCSMLGSFHVPLLDGEFSFSSTSFHASFVTQEEIVVLDVQGSKIVFQTKATQPLYDPPGQFSHDGSLLACKTLDGNICIWKSTPTGYVPWNTLKPRLLFHKFLFSPTATSILTWGPTGIQLLHPESSASPPSLDESKPLNQSRKHLMACSESGAYIVIAQQGGDIATVLDSLLGIPVQSIHAGVEIQAIGIVDNTIFVASEHKLVSWNLGAEEGATVSGSHNIYALSPWIGQAGRLVVSSDHSQVAFTSGKSGTIILYDITAQKLTKPQAHVITPDVQFSQDGHWLYVCNCYLHRFNPFMIYLIKFEMEGGCLVSTSEKCLEDRESWDRFFPPSHRYRVVMSNWVVDSSDCKYLWLPPNWRTEDESDVGLDGRFLALVGNHHQKPIIMELQPQPHLLPNQSKRASFISLKREMNHHIRLPH